MRSNGPLFAISVSACLLLVPALACNRGDSKDGASSSSGAVASAASTSAPAASARTATSASAVIAPIAVASASPNAGCAALAWDKDGMNAAVTSFAGKIGSGEGTNGRNETEKFQTLVLDKPACGPDKNPVTELQLYTNDKKIELAKSIGKHVTIEGEPFSAMTAHHHRPIVVEVKKLTAM